MRLDMCEMLNICKHHTENYGACIYNHRSAEKTLAAGDCFQHALRFGKRRNQSTTDVHHLQWHSVAGLLMLVDLVQTTKGFGESKRMIGQVFGAVQSLDETRKVCVIVPTARIESRCGFTAGCVMRRSLAGHGDNGNAIAFV